MSSVKQSGGLSLANKAAHGLGYQLHSNSRQLASKLIAGTVMARPSPVSSEGHAVSRRRYEAHQRSPGQPEAEGFCAKAQREALPLPLPEPSRLVAKKGSCSIGISLRFHRCALRDVHRHYSYLRHVTNEMKELRTNWKKRSRAVQISKRIVST